jgi:TPR repeat protein
MKPLVLDGSACRRSHSKVVASLILQVLFSLTLFDSFSQAADDQASKAVRRSSSESGLPVKDQKRVALVIGNSNYQVGPLRNPVNDAQDISGVLRTLGFTVQTKTNVNHLEMEEAVNRFVQEIQNGDVALFYFSGHGIQVKGENYLIPLGGSVASETDVRFKTLNAGLVLGKMEESRNRTNIVILDACRNNPFKGLFRSPSTGLSKMDAPKGTFIAYATSPDSVAADGTERNSPYTKHLIEALKMRDIPIELAFKQVARAVNKETGGQQTPWISSSLLDDFYCNPSSSTSPQVASLSPSTSPGQASGQALPERQEVSDPCDNHIQNFRALMKKVAGEHQLSQFCMKSEIMQCVLPWIEKAAGGGDRRAQATLGVIYLGGYGVPLDQAESSKWFKKAAEGGSRIDPWLIVATGKGWDERSKVAAENGLCLAQYNLAQLYRNGVGVIPKDLAQAVYWYKKAAEQGDPNAQFELGWMYANEEGVAKDYKESLKWYRKAAEQGNIAAWINIGVAYENGHGVPKDYEEAVKCYKKGAETNWAGAQSNLGGMYWSGKGVPKDYDEAVKWFRRAAEKNDVKAFYVLGLAHELGLGAYKDREEAIKWLRKAEEKGHEEARKRLRKMGVAVKPPNASTADKKNNVSKQTTREAPAAKKSP